MIEGRKPKRKTDWNSIKSPGLDLSKAKRYVKYRSCASSALSMVTGLSAIKLDRYNKMREDWTWADTAKLLRKLGYTLTEVTKESICNTHWQNHELKTDHLLWCCCRFGPDDYSAVLVHGGIVWHNFERVTDPLFFMNKPTEYVVVISHPRFRKKRSVRTIDTTPFYSRYA